MVDVLRLLRIFENIEILHRPGDTLHALDLHRVEIAHHEVRGNAYSLQILIPRIGCDHVVLFRRLKRHSEEVAGPHDDAAAPLLIIAYAFIPK